jgi:hypothetical protein
VRTIGGGENGEDAVPISFSTSPPCAWIAETMTSA